MEERKENEMQKAVILNSVRIISLALRMKQVPTTRPIKLESLKVPPRHWYFKKTLPGNSDVQPRLRTPEPADNSVSALVSSLQKGLVFVLHACISHVLDSWILHSFYLWLCQDGYFPKGKKNHTCGLWTHLIYTTQLS